MHVLSQMLWLFIALRVRVDTRDTRERGAHRACPVPKEICTQWSSPRCPLLPLAELDGSSRILFPFHIQQPEQRNICHWCEWAIKQRNAVAPIGGVPVVAMPTRCRRGFPVSFSLFLLLRVWGRAAAATVLPQTSFFLCNQLHFHGFANRGPTAEWAFCVFRNTYAGWERGGGKYFHTALDGWRREGNAEMEIRSHLFISKWRKTECTNECDRLFKVSPRRGVRTRGEKEWSSDKSVDGNGGNCPCLPCRLLCLYDH